MEVEIRGKARLAATDFYIQATLDSLRKHPEGSPSDYQEDQTSHQAPKS